LGSCSKLEDSGHPQRSSKAKSKGPDLSAPVIIFEDESELVVAVFKRITYDKTGYLHHALENTMHVPPPTDYQDTLSAPLPPSTFADSITTSRFPAPIHPLCLARVVYPDWHERRLEAGGKRIIPTFNSRHFSFDLLPLSHISCSTRQIPGTVVLICFRRREFKAVRKARTSHIAFSDKLIRLKSELATVFEIANEAIGRETLTKDAAQLQQKVWDQCIVFSDLKRRVPSLSMKEDEEPLVDDECVPKKPKVEPQVPAQSVSIG
jgi:enhancer of polycomb-like protein